MKTVLIVEDDPRTAAALETRFRKAGYATQKAQDTIQGFQLALRQPPDLMLLDIGLPGGDGLSLAHQLRARPETRHVPFVLVTASKDPDLYRKAMDLGAAGLLEKPYDAGDLLALALYAMGDTQVCIRNRPVPAPQPPSTLPGAKKILIVEDDSRIAKALAVRLHSAGFETATAYDALTAVSTGVKIQPDLMLLDISMPAGDGFMVAERLQSLLPTRTPVIFLTASKQASLREKASALGAAGYFEKPFDAETLLTSIRQALLN